jgi:uncharacterized protein (TIGR00730 family)
MPQKIYEVGDEILDNLISELAKKSSSLETENLLNEILTSVVKLGLESKDTGDLKLVNSALKELRYSFKAFSPYRNRKKVVIFGSARSNPESIEYKMSEDFAKKMSDKGYMIVTGGGPGVMEAGNKGSKIGKSFALNIKLPFEQKTNPYISDKDKIIYFKYFFTRKLMFIKETDATALFYGGFGTQDEGFEILTLIQTGKSKPRPIIFVEPEGETYWTEWFNFINNQLVKKGYIKKNDLNIFYIVKSVDDGIKYIENFYKIYHSIRYVGTHTVIRLNKRISENTLKSINENFKDLLVSGDFKLAGPTEKEIKCGEYLDLPRLIFNFCKRDYGRLYELIHFINEE